MSEHYYGTIGKDKSWGLLADKRIVVYRKSETEAKFTAVNTIAEAEALYHNVGDSVYFWDNGDWQEVQFLVQGDKSKAAIGFSPK